eukprot:scaffold19670_cov54-Phaeocystis_antarctica.AAC.3
MAAACSFPGMFHAATMLHRRRWAARAAEPRALIPGGALAPSCPPPSPAAPVWEPAVPASKGAADAMRWQLCPNLLRARAWPAASSGVGVAA